MRVSTATAALLILVAPATAEPLRLPIQSAAAACMPCQAKCPKCIKIGRFSSVEACIQDCNARGNPSVNASCGVFKRCGM